MGNIIYLKILTVSNSAPLGRCKSNFNCFNVMEFNNIRSETGSNETVTNGNALEVKCTKKSYN